MITCMNVTDKNKSILTERILKVLKPAGFPSWGRGHTVGAHGEVLCRSRDDDDDDDDGGGAGGITWVAGCPLQPQVS